MHNPKLAPNPIAAILQFTPPQLYTGKEWYVGFYAYDPALNRMRRKKIKINFIQKVGERREYAKGLIRRLNSQLEKGWNPWIESTNGKAYHLLDDVFVQYRRFLDKMFADDIYRKDTYDSYSSYLRNVEKWNISRKERVTFIYQFDSTFVQQFLDHVYLERNNSPQTRNNYLIWLGTFSSWLVQNRYLKTKPTEELQLFGKKSIRKKREIISDTDMRRIRDYISKKNKHYLLACYVLFYCFIRPKEMSMIKIEHISLSRQTLFIPDNNSKNRRDGTVTLPAKVIQLMIDLNIFDNPGSYYLFSDNFMPGIDYKSEKQFRDYWSRTLRKALNLPSTLKFYSLKDTGITSMLKSYPSLTVRDQARHSTILMTDIYTPHDIQTANEMIKNHEADF